tara:strand:- start:173 stop:400 length:228 start_codon:yes stop_codon:yes gene_type:complete
MNHRRLVRQSIAASGCKTFTAYAEKAGVSRQAVMGWMKNNYVPEKSRMRVARASHGQIHPRFFTPLWEKCRCNNK